MAQRQKIAFQGEYGAFSEQAALAFFGNGCTPVPREGFRDVFQDVLTKKVSAGIVPVENSLFGSVHQNFDLLQEFPLSIVGEVKLRIRMNLMSLPGTSLRSVRNVYSHPQALGQSDRFLRSLKDVTLHQFYDTAGAAKMIAEQQLTGAAAIASLQAAEHYGLKVLKKGIETDRQNFTRFVVLSRTPVRPRGAAKTSLIFSTNHAPGSLVQCLSLFAERGVNLLKIESRPIVGRPWEYLFFVDVAGSSTDEHLVSALTEMKEHTSSLKILGSYTIGKVVR
ncbi:MAG: prephenate dehydratase [Bacteroidetes bacterium]|nr:prephenate dehydratase [Bacteroidota bacterium]